MEEESNQTYITFGGHVELHKYRYLYFLVVFTIYILIICSNCTIVYLIWNHHDLHEPMYIFIAALLLNSVLLSTNIYPKLLIDFLSEKQMISYQACLVQYSLFYTFVDSEFLLLAAMAYDRYVSICKPLQYPTVMRGKMISIFLFCSFTLEMIFCNNSIFKLFCVPSSAVSLYGVLYFLWCVIFPLLFILFTYNRIFIICYHNSGEVRSKAAQTCFPHLLVLINYFYLLVCGLITARIESDISNTARIVMNLQIILYNPLFNPVIYGLKMKEIHKHLSRLLRLCKMN
uniref:G-protein coupled receptors family 1 profile domain-containing protein n=1 Tax=Monopterus albus TaxID=43700 RepID=A0A3Q3IDN9_MONAL